MRTMIITAACAALAACGGPETSQAKNAQANISNDSRTTTHAVASTLTPSATTSGSTQSKSGDQAKAVMHERHEGMKPVGKANKARPASE
jgi:spermidine/putrescine-binding protein